MSAPEHINGALWYKSDLADSYNYIGVLYQETKRFTEAEDAYKQAIALFEQKVKENSSYKSDLVDSYNSLASLYLKTNRIIEAIKIKYKIFRM